MRRFTISVLLATLVSIGGCEGGDLHERKFVGVQKSEIVRLLGEPDKIEVMVKRGEHIFGPIETVWSGMEMGDRIVTWTYDANNGQKLLYFVNDSTEVAEESFWFNDENKNPVY